mmetsp:Transcript_35727/g.70001  ORF Transcript_35727/g.70001 Transcript_35727/m.70001 type:complete len:416 (-) Transcript_35727:110-1357(-)|eukprot:CAMPEP_0173390288 /NCGR_PEP_ID=MMETSP1356-20130122/14399_1 /TAXON_ID=77927 ORGANISM="Hemiselmis virescens, Strain PCC157" /NCGR_SAMPLE_ID=MMETSP1356 /ASSEMBLY_ACC=CAM_ASM_000847 /LENGTH=415 /DNA_ID=CAMNT_0014347631 /DNA_START=73 /DNA_END=1320 /DNA_ORIENTATION=+
MASSHISLRGAAKQGASLASRSLFTAALRSRSTSAVSTGMLSQRITASIGRSSKAIAVSRALGSAFVGGSRTYVCTVVAVPPGLKGYASQVARCQQLGCTTRRSLSTVTPAEGTKPEILSIFQAGINEPEMIEFNKVKRTIRAKDHVVKAIHAKLSETVQGVFTSNDDEGRNVVNWPAHADAAVEEYIKARSGDKSVLKSTFVYQGAFSVGVKRVKVLSLFSLILTSVGGPLLVVGEQSATMGQWAVAAAIVFFGTSTTGLLHLITSPYVLTLRRIADGSFEAETPLITGGVKTTKFTKQEIMPSSRPFTSFTAKGQGLFVHKELFIGDDAQMMLCDVLGEKVAEEMYEALLQKDPNDLDTLYNYGRFLWKVRGDYEAAEGAFTAILAEDASDTEVLAAFQAMNAERGKTTTPPA